MSQAFSSLGSSAPIGVFDSGVGGLSVLQALRAELPAEQFIYLADSGHAPYGERGDAFVAARTHDIARYLIAHHGIKALVVACNTATAAAMETLRQAWPLEVAMVGVEPAVKPAARSSQTHHVGVIGTRGTVQSQRFARLLQLHGEGVHFHVQACDGLARAIEASTVPQMPGVPAADEVQDLCTRYVGQLGHFGLKTGEMDTLVLGCTHYVFVKDILRALVGPDVQLVDTGAAVARQTRRLLEQAGHLRSGVARSAQALAGPAQIQLQTTGQLAALQAAAQRWLGLPASCCGVADLPLSAGTQHALSP